MIIKSIRVRNFRSIKNEALSCDCLTTLVGANGAGKSTFLHALRLFYEDTQKIEPEDFYDSDTAQEISIEVTFTELEQEAKDLFASYVRDGNLVVEKVFSVKEGKVTGKYHGARLQNPDFNEVRNATNATTAKEKYTELKKNPKYSNFGSWSSQVAVRKALDDWESANPTSCALQRDDGQFFGFREVANGYLGRFSRFLYIPAVRDAAADSVDDRSSILSQLMDLVVRNTLATKEELKEFQISTATKYKDVLDPAKLTELGAMSEEMTRTLQDFVPGASIELQWKPLEELKIPLPKADIKLVEDGYLSTVARTGHGLQRAFIMTMLQHLSTVKDAVANPTPESPNPRIASVPDLVLVIEEPELYQHPSRQRHLARVFERLSRENTPGVARKTQIIYSTHSPHFVSIERISEIRLLRKVTSEEGKPKVTKIWSTTMEEVASRISKSRRQNDRAYDDTSVLSRLGSVMTPLMSEGFFSHAVVLVEGEGDRAAILAVANNLGHEFDSMGYSIISCNGKTNLDRPIAIFSNLGIPVFAVWDGDHGKQGANYKHNHRLLRLLGRTEEDWPEFIEANFACFKADLETKLIEELGKEFFDQNIEELHQLLGISRKDDAMKNPYVVSSLIQRAHDSGKKCQFLEKVVAKIVALTKS